MDDSNRPVGTASEENVSIFELDSNEESHLLSNKNAFYHSDVSRYTGAFIATGALTALECADHEKVATKGLPPSDNLYKPMSSDVMGFALPKWNSLLLIETK